MTRPVMPSREGFLARRSLAGPPHVPLQPLRAYRSSTVLPMSAISLRPSRQVTHHELGTIRGQLPANGAQDVQAGVVGGPHILQIEEDAVVTAAVQAFHRASQQVGTLHRQVAADSH